MHAFVLADPARCIGCRACEIACAAAHMEEDMGQAMARGLPFAPRLCLVRESGVTAPIQCRQCEDAPCAAACPTGAVASDGRAVTVAAERCVGCKACLAACPVGAMQVGRLPGDQGGPVAHKCDLCAGRRETPACVAVCPAGALRLISRDVLRGLAVSRRRRQAASLAQDAK
ncbi:MAG: 4Fe-4S dicluster domain-containing protein [Desulfovibrio sp.]